MHRSVCIDCWSSFYPSEHPEFFFHKPMIIRGSPAFLGIIEDIVWIKKIDQCASSWKNRSSLSLKYMNYSEILMCRSIRRYQCDIDTYKLSGFRVDSHIKRLTPGSSRNNNRLIGTILSFCLSGCNEVLQQRSEEDKMPLKGRTDFDYWVLWHWLEFFFWWPLSLTLALSKLLTNNKLLQVLYCFCWYQPRFYLPAFAICIFA